MEGVGPCAIPGPVNTGVEGVGPYAQSLGRVGASQLFQVLKLPPAMKIREFALPLGKADRQTQSPESLVHSDGNAQRHLALQL